MKIVNNTNLNYQQIGFIIDDIINKSVGETIYFGKVSYLNIMFNELKINIRIRYLKRYVEWSFREINNERNIRYLRRYVEWSFTNNERIKYSKTDNH